VFLDELFVELHEVVLLESLVVLDDAVLVPHDCESVWISVCAVLNVLL
jgi:hypothetical protein